MRKGLLLLVLIVLLFPTGFLGWMMISEFRPEGIANPEASGKASGRIMENHEFSVMSWNIGYAGLGKGMDFFYDGGKRVRDEQKQVEINLRGITGMTSQADSIDFLCIQEADRNAKRSWYFDNYAVIGQSLPDYAGLFAKNYDCRFVPMPLSEPMGHVVSGIACFSRYNPLASECIYFDITFPWPKRLFFLKRCFMAMRFDVGGGREMVLINTHNSAFDSTGELRQRELEILGKFMTREFQKGNFVIAGGDWNSNPRGFDPGTITSGDLAVVVEPPVPPTFLPGWKFAFDSTVPSNRFLDEVYRRGHTRTTVIDFFVVSPNVEVVDVRTISDGFRYADHHPVILKYRLAGAD